jgi:hypothetical protein
MHWRHRHHHHHHRHQVLTYVYLRLSYGTGKYLFLVGTLSKDWIIMDAQVSIGHVINAELSFLDQNGNPMLVTPKPDAVPTWANLAPAVETLVASADGLQAVITPLTVGVDTVSVSLTVGGVMFNATLNVAVAAAPQVLTSVEIKSTVV